MPSSQPTEIVLPTLTKRDRLVIEALEADYLDGGQGVPHSEIEQIAGTTYLKRVIRRIRAAGYNVVSSGSREAMTCELMELPHNPLGAGRWEVSGASPSDVDSSSGADAEGELLLFDPPAVSHHRQDLDEHDLARRPRRAA